MTSFSNGGSFLVYYRIRPANGTIGTNNKFSNNPKHSTSVDPHVITNVGSEDFSFPGLVNNDETCHELWNDSIHSRSPVTNNAPSNIDIKKVDSNSVSVFVDACENAKRPDSGEIFEQILSNNYSQEKVFNVVARPLVRALINGENSLLFTYGPAGSGKTYTMCGTHGESIGIIPRCLNLIFKSVSSYQCQSCIFKPDNSNIFRIQSEKEAYHDRCKVEAQIIDQKWLNVPDGYILETDRTAVVTVARPSNTFSVFVTFLEISHDVIDDLLENYYQGSNTSLKADVSVADNDDQNGCARAITEIEIRSAAQGYGIYNEGMKSRKAGSHTVFRIRVVQALKDQVKNCEISDPETVLVSELLFVDLAGCIELKLGNQQFKSLHDSLFVLEQSLQLNRSADELSMRHYQLSHILKNYLDHRSCVRMIVCSNYDSNNQRYENIAVKNDRVESTDKVEPCVTSQVTKNDGLKLINEAENMESYIKERDHLESTAEKKLSAAQEITDSIDISEETESQMPQVFTNSVEITDESESHHSKVSENSTASEIDSLDSQTRLDEVPTNPTEFTDVVRSLKSQISEKDAKIAELLSNNDKLLLQLSKLKEKLYHRRASKKKKKKRKRKNSNGTGHSILSIQDCNGLIASTNESSTGIVLKFSSVSSYMKTNRMDNSESEQDQPQLRMFENNYEYNDIQREISGSLENGSTSEFEMEEIISNSESINWESALELPAMPLVSSIRGGVDLSVPQLLTPEIELTVGDDAAAESEGSAAEENDDLQSENDWDDNYFTNNESYQTFSDESQFESAETVTSLYTPLEDGPSSSAKRFKCPICHYTNTTPKGLKLHMIKFHNGHMKYKKRVSCQDCGYFYPDSSSYRKHLSAIGRCAGAHKHVCELCNTAFPRGQSLKRHKFRIHKIAFVTSERKVGEDNQGKNSSTLKRLLMRGMSNDVAALTNELHTESSVNSHDNTSSFSRDHVFNSQTEIDSYNRKDSSRNFSNESISRNSVKNDGSSQKCPLCSYTSYNDRALASHIKKKHHGHHMIKKRVFCDGCQHFFPDSSSFQKHLLDDGLCPGRMQHVCEHCNTAFSYRSSMVRHKIIVHNWEPSEGQGIDLGKVSRLRKRYTSSRSRKIKPAHEGPSKGMDILPLEHESTSFQSERQTAGVNSERRMKSEPGGSKFHQCHLCDFSTDKPLGLTTHIRMKHFGQCKKRIKCGGCNYFFPGTTSYENHLQATGPCVQSVRHVCNLCNTAFTARENMRRHQFIVHKQMPKRGVNLLGGKLSTKLREKLLQRQILRERLLLLNKKPKITHNPDSTVKNESCVQKIVTSPAPVQSTSYTESFSGKCSVCDFTSLKKGGIAQHFQRKHLGRHVRKKRVSCNICGYLYPDSNSFKKHLRSGGQCYGSMMHICKLCNTAFAQKMNMRRHQFKIHKMPSMRDLKRDSGLELIKSEVLQQPEQNQISDKNNFKGPFDDMDMGSFCETLLVENAEESEEDADDASQILSPFENDLSPVQDVETLIYKCHLCSYSSHKKKGLDLHIRFKHFDNRERKRQVSCPECGFFYPDSSSYKKHLNGNGECGGSCQHVCDICNTAFPRKQSMIRHKILVHQQPPNSSESFDNTSNGKSSRRRVRKQKLENDVQDYQDYYEQIVTSDESSFSAQEPLDSAANDEFIMMKQDPDAMMDYHYQQSLIADFSVDANNSALGSDPNFVCDFASLMPGKCPLCHYSNSNVKSLKFHIQKKHMGHAKKRVLCNVCQHFYPDSCSFKKHFDSSGMCPGQMQHVCEVCNTALVSRPSLIRHRLLVHKLTADDGVTNCDYASKGAEDVQVKVDI